MTPDERARRIDPAVGEQARLAKKLQSLTDQELEAAIGEALARLKVMEDLVAALTDELSERAKKKGSVND